MPFKMGQSCFSGKRSSYDDWAASVVSRNEDADLTTFHKRFPEDDYKTYKNALDCHFITYPVGELTIRGVYVRPKGLEGRDLPVLIVNRGGNGPSGAWNFGRMFQKVLPMANAGYVVIGSQYRGSRKGDDPSVYGSDEFGGEDINDVLALFDIIDRLPGADADRIGMYGWSRGGFVALMVATKTGRLKAIAVGGTPTDLAAELEIRPEMERVFRARIPNYDEDKHAALKARSAVRWADEIDADLPILILHGEQDNRVSLKSAQKLAEVLVELQHQHKLVTYESGSHGLLERNQEVIDELLAWFDTYLAEVEKRR
jgi:dipeptidyl aminopeptidase/acylaminoacyl peptidase